MSFSPFILATLDIDNATKVSWRATQLLYYFVLPNLHVNLDSVPPKLAHLMSLHVVVLKKCVGCWLSHLLRVQHQQTETETIILLLQKKERKKQGEIQDNFLTFVLPPCVLHLQSGKKEPGFLTSYQAFKNCFSDFLDVFWGHFWHFWVQFWHFSVIFQRFEPWKIVKKWARKPVKIVHCSWWNTVESSFVNWSEEEATSGCSILNCQVCFLW